jgi:hypothetical protein
MFMFNADYSGTTWTLFYEFYYSIFVYCLALVLVKAGSSKTYRYIVYASLIMI